MVLCLKFAIQRYGICRLFEKLLKTKQTGLIPRKMWLSCIIYIIAKRCPIHKTPNRSSILGSTASNLWQGCHGIIICLDVNAVIAKNTGIFEIKDGVVVIRCASCYIKQCVFKRSMITIIRMYPAVAKTDHNRCCLSGIVAKARTAYISWFHWNPTPLRWLSFPSSDIFNLRQALSLTWTIGQNEMFYWVWQ